MHDSWRRYTYGITLHFDRVGMPETSALPHCAFVFHTNSNWQMFICYAQLSMSLHSAHKYCGAICHYWQLHCKAFRLLVMRAG